MEPANTSVLPETQVSITFPFCFNQHSDHRMLQSFLRINSTNWLLSKAWSKNQTPAVICISSTYKSECSYIISIYLKWHFTLYFSYSFVVFSGNFFQFKLTLLLLFAMACKQDLSFWLKYLFSVCWCPSEAIIFGGRPPSSPSKIW